ncbi:hypothetical protein Taro_000503, partial [Colocasia esculenta]|nr:hypothetical protein [Colocasia esculenta]
ESTLWTPTLTPASSDVDANFSDLHALQSPEFREQASSPIGELSPTIRGFGATSGHLQRLGDSWSIREGFPDFSLVSTSVKNPEEGVIGGFLGLPKESFIATFDPFGVFFRGKYPTHNVPPWLREVGVAERQPVRTSHDVTSGRSSRTRHRKVLNFPHRCLWTMEYSCKAHTQAALQAQLEAQAQVPAQDHGGPSTMERFKRMLPPSFKGESDPLLAESWMREIEKVFRAIRCADEDKVTLATYMLQTSLRTRLLAFDHRTLDEALSAACRQEGEMEQYLEEKKASQKRPAATFQRQDKKKVVYQTPQRSVAVGRSQVPSVRSPSVKKECPHCGKTHGGTECWMITGKCLKCGSSDHKIKDCPRLQQEVQHGAPAPIYHDRL